MRQRCKGNTPPLLLFLGLFNVPKVVLSEFKPSTDLRNVLQFAVILQVRSPSAMLYLPGQAWFHYPASL
jgi:hypothetical protein